jgi:hypothetical protein
VALELPVLLRAHHRIRLAPGADYRRSPAISLQSGDALYGAAGTRVSAIVITPGTHDAIVSGVVPEALEFPASKVATTHNCFERFAARTYEQQPLTLQSAAIEDNLFLDAGQIFVDTSQSGRVLNNRFIRTLVHGASPAIVMRGRGADSSDRNVFLWVNVLGPIGDGVLIDGESQVNIVGLDAENWNQHALATRPAMMAVSNTQAFRGFVLQGGAQTAVPTRYLDVSAEEVELSAVRLYRAAIPAVKLGDMVSEFTNLMPVNLTVQSTGRLPYRLTAFENGAEKIVFGGTDAERRYRTPRARSSAWEAPHLHPLTDPNAAERLRQRLTAPDSRQRLQDLIDSQGIAAIPAGTYYISGPLRLRNGQGIIGAGADRTFIVAKTSAVDLVEGADHYENKQATGFSLIDVTLQGGRNGIRHDERGAGKGAQFNLIHLSHVVIRDMAAAGISISGIYGWDNNLIDHVAFYGMPVGVRQIPSSWYVSSAANGDVEGMNYMDKNVWYRCQFEEVEIGMQLEAKRANGLNACIECLFRHNTAGAMRLTYNVSTVVANSDFIENGGDPVVASNMPIGIVASRFVDGSGKSFLDSDSICEGCQFTHAHGMTSVARAGGRLLLINSRSTGVPLGNVAAGLLVNSSLPEADKFPAEVIDLNAGQLRPVVSGRAAPYEALLSDWEYP